MGQFDPDNVFAKQVEDLEPIIWNFLRTQLSEAELSDFGEDVVYETVARFWTYGETQEIKAPKGFCRRTAKNLLIDDWRHRLRHESAWQRVGDEALLGTQRDLSAVDEMLLQEEEEKLRAALATLSEAERAAVAAYHLSGVSQEKAAKSLGISVSKLKTRIARAMKKLHQILTENENAS